MATKNTGTKPKNVESAVQAVVSSPETVEETQDEVREERKSFKPKQLDPDQIVTVKNGFHGLLVYQSRRTGERFVWDSFGAEQDMELSELKSAKNSNKKYFINNWFLFDDPEIVEYLGLSMYYKNALKLEDFDTLFEKNASEVEKIISKLSEGQKRSVAYRAKQLIADGGIDSHKTITTLEKCLGIELIER